jgi:hypothetical protein
MVSPAATSPAAALPDALRPLAKELAKLPEGEREMVIRAARSENARRVYPTMSWTSLMSSAGIVSFGGNAIEDSDALFDG